MAHRAQSWIVNFHGIGPISRPFDPGEEDVWLEEKAFCSMLDAIVGAQGIEITFDDEKEWIRRVTGQTPLRLVGRNRAHVSLLPLTPCSKVSTTGLKWNLEERDLSHDEGSSQSNLGVSDLVTVSCSSGNLFVILQK